LREALDELRLGIHWSGLNREIVPASPPIPPQSTANVLSRTPKRVPAISPAVGSRGRRGRAYLGNPTQRIHLPLPIRWGEDRGEVETASQQAKQRRTTGESLSTTALTCVIPQTTRPTPLRAFRSLLHLGIPCRTLPLLLQPASGATRTWCFQPFRRAARPQSIGWHFARRTKRSFMPRATLHTLRSRLLAPRHSI